MKKNKIKILLAMLVICTSMTACNKIAKDLSSSEIDVKLEKQTFTNNEETEKEIEVTEEEVSNTDPRYVPKGEKISDDIPLNVITFSDDGEPLFTIDISDCTLADLIETAELSSGTKIEVKGEDIVLRYDTPEFYLMSQSFRINGGDDFDIETIIGNEIVTERSSYEPSDSPYTNPNTSYSEMKIKNLNISRTMTKKERLSFCGGEIGFETPKADIEKLLSTKGEDVIVNHKDGSGERILHVWQNKNATLAIKYGDGTHTAEKDTVEEIYVFANN